MDTGFITLHRKIKDNEIWKNPDLSHLFIHLLLSANYDVKKFLFNGKVEQVYRGQLITGRKVLSQETGINESKITRLLKILQDLEIIDIKPNSRFSLITIVKYSDYQDSREKVNKRTNNKRTTDEQQVNTNNNINKENNNNKLGATLSPAQEAKEFFESEEKPLRLATVIAEKYSVPKESVILEIRKFIDYWTESNKLGTKQRWEQQPTFEVKKRLNTWLNNIKQFNRQPAKKGNLVL